MQTLPFAVSSLWATLVAYPFALIGTILFAVALHRLAERWRCYGLPRNLLFTAVSGALAFALLQAYVFLSRSYGLRSMFLAEIVAGYETAVVITFIRRLVFSQRPPRKLPSVQERSE